MFRVNDSNLALLGCIVGVVALIVGAVGIASPAPGIKSETDPLACTATKTPGGPNDCANGVGHNTSYCPSVSDNDPSNPCLVTGDALTTAHNTRSTTFTTSSTTFVTVLSAVTTAPGFGPFLCIVTFNFNENSLTGNSQWQIIDGIGHTSNVYQTDNSADAVVSSNMIGSLSWYDNTIAAITTFSFQTKVSAGTITLNVIKSDISCFVVNQDLSGVVG